LRHQVRLVTADDASCHWRSTEHGAIMAATVLSSPRAVEVSVYVVRAFVQLRALSLSHRDLAKLGTLK